MLVAWSDRGTATDRITASVVEYGTVVKAPSRADCSVSATRPKHGWSRAFNHRSSSARGTAVRNHFCPGGDVGKWRELLASSAGILMYRDRSQASGPAGSSRWTISGGKRLNRAIPPCKSLKINPQNGWGLLCSALATRCYAKRNEEQHSYNSNSPYQVLGVVALTEDQIAGLAADLRSHIACLNPDQDVCWKPPSSA
jgi:hypothetical protein